MSNFRLRSLADTDREQLVQFWQNHWGAPIMVSRGRRYHAADLPGILAVDAAGNWLGLLTYHAEAGAYEVVSLDAIETGQGIGTALLGAFVELAQAAAARRIWLITTNDNTHALRFYQRRGWRLVALHTNAVAESRRLKPGIPLIGMDGIPIRDELELEFPLADR